MICKLSSSDLNSILVVINDASQAYKGVIPDDRWKEPYMSAEELKKELRLALNSMAGWKTILYLE